MHGGKVEVYSALGQGSEFVVRLPVMANARNAAAIDSQRQRRRRLDHLLRVLVVDDNVDAAQSLGLLLEASGHDVRTAYDGPTALEAALDYRPNVVLLDIGLPGIDGFEVAKRLRQQPDLSGVVLVAMTGYGQERTDSVRRTLGSITIWSSPPTSERCSKSWRPSGKGDLMPTSGE